MFVTLEIVADELKLLLQVTRYIFSQVILGAYLVDLDTKIDDVFAVILPSFQVVRLAPSGLQE
jgi:hypothetical protein